MTQLGRRLAVIGMILMAATMMLFGRDIERGLQARRLVTIPLEVGNEAKSDVLSVEAGRGCQVAVIVAVESESVAETAGAGHAVRYSFPFACTVRNAGGKAVFSEQGAIRWDQGTRHVRDERADASGGRARVQHNLARFDVPPPGQITVQARLMPDTEFAATAETAELRVYDNITRPADEMVVAAVAVLFGPAVMILGATLAIVGWARARRHRDDEADLPVEPEMDRPEGD
jgi:hypothetical protein